MLNIYKKVSYSSSAFITGSIFSTQGLKALIIGSICLVLSVMFLTGCGQKGDLYLPEEAPSNVDYTIYKANKTPEAKAEQALNQQKIEEAAAEDPQDY